MLPITSQVKLRYDAIKGGKNNFEGDIISFGMTDGTILVAYLSLQFDKEKVTASILPQQLYKNQTENHYDSSIFTLYIDPNTDHIIAGNMQGDALIFNKSITHVVVNENNTMNEKQINK